MFLRFVIARKDPDSSKREGVFAPAYQLLKRGELEPDLHDRLCLALEWFQLHLPLPDRSRIEARGIFWFRANASAPVQQMWEIARIVESSGLSVDQIRTDKPGYILYEDEFQVCAVPFRDTGT